MPDTKRCLACGRPRYKYDLCFDHYREYWEIRRRAAEVLDPPPAPVRVVYTGHPGGRVLRKKL